METMEIKVSKEDIVSWVKKQPDDRKIDMYQNHSNDPCGCLMVQYGKENFKEPFTSCGSSVWWNTSAKTAVLEYPIGVFIPSPWYKYETFGDLKKIPRFQ